MKKMMMLLAFSLYLLSSTAQATKLQSGPMVGYSEMREVLLWAQTKESAKVQFSYWEVGKTAKEGFKTASVQTNAVTVFTAKLVADQVEPSKKYQYQLFINDVAVTLPYPTTFQTQAIWQFRTDPPNFKVALGSCTYVNEEPYDRPGTPYGGEYQIFENIAKQQPDLMIWLGDNTYLREVDWYTWKGIAHRYTHTRSLPEMQPLLASTHHYAIWDDHDFGPNDSDRSFIHKDKTLKAFDLFWGNPSCGIPQAPGGNTSYFHWADMDFFLLDDRSFRSPNTCKTCTPEILGKAQTDWLIDALTASRAPFKFVAIGGQVLNSATVYENYIHHHQPERDYLLKRIEEEGIRNVIFLTGDRHHTELSKIVNRSGNTVYDFTVSPLTSGAANNVIETNTNRVSNTFVNVRNFGTLEIFGTRTARQLKMSIFDSSGKEIWSQTIASEVAKQGN